MIIIRFLCIVFFASAGFCLEYNYSINFLWIQSPDKPIFNNNRADIIQRLVDTATENREAMVYFWLDGLEIDALNELRCAFEAQGLSNIEIKSLSPIIADKAAYFSEKIPLYFKIDFAKQLIAQHQLDEAKGYKYYFVYSDLDFKSTYTKATLFDEETLSYLQSQPFICGIVNGFNENSFFIIENNSAGKNINNEMINSALKFLVPPYISPQGFFGIFRGTLAMNNCFYSKEVFFPDSHFFSQTY